MDVGKIILYGSMAIIFLGLPVMLLGIALFGLSANNQGDTIRKSGGATIETGPVSDQIPPQLAAVFAEAREKTGTTTPVSVLAAISLQECNFLWDYTRKHPEEVERIINNNEDVAHVPNGLSRAQRYTHPNHWGCGFDNGSRVWGPMQFLDKTFGIPKGADAKTHPVPREPGYGARASKFTSRAPGVSGQQGASMLSIKDSVYAASIMLYENAGKPADKSWKEANVISTAKLYYGKCVYAGVNYCDDIVAKWKRFGGESGQ